MILARDQTGQPYLINELSIKEFPACFAVNPAIKTVFKLQEKHDIAPDQIKSILVDSYPYSYDLDGGLPEPLNTTSSRLSLKHSVSAAIIDGEVTPATYTTERLSDPRYVEMRNKVNTSRHNEYGSGPTGKRACIIEITLMDGQVLREEYDSALSVKDNSDEYLLNKFNGLTEEALEKSQQNDLYEFAMSLERQENLSPMLDLLKAIPIIG